jgi:hypothetical protein
MAAGLSPEAGYAYRNIKVAKGELVIGDELRADLRNDKHCYTDAEIDLALPRALERAGRPRMKLGYPSPSESKRPCLPIGGVVQRVFGFPHPAFHQKHRLTPIICRDHQVAQQGLHAGCSQPGSPLPSSNAPPVRGAVPGRCQPSF